jgi:arabinogalactan oligomer/maltooligosaccharide transport system permease protein
MRKRINLGKINSLAFSYAYLILFAMFVLLPIVYIVSVSFNENGSLYEESLIPSKLSLANYMKLITETQFVQWYINTIIAGAMTSVLTLLFVAPTAFAFSRLRFWGRKKMLLAFLVLQMFPGMMAMVAYYVLLNMVGLLDTTLGLVLLYAGGAIPGMTWLLKGFLDTIPKALEEAAIIDGANKLQILRKIIIPLSVPVLVMVAVFAFAAPFGDFVLSRIVLTDNNKFTLALGTYNFIAGEYSKNYTIFAASSILAGLPITLLYLRLQKTIFSGFNGSVVR